MSKKKEEPADVLKCPFCKERFLPDLWDGTGNYEEQCPACDSVLQFHVEIIFDGVTVISEGGEE